jgi:hypothetical protein
MVADLGADVIRTEGVGFEELEDEEAGFFVPPALAGLLLDVFGFLFALWFSSSVSLVSSLPSPWPESVLVAPAEASLSASRVRSAEFKPSDLFEWRSASRSSSERAAMKARIAMWV